MSEQGKENEQQAYIIVEGYLDHKCSCWLTESPCKTCDGLVKSITTALNAKDAEIDALKGIRRFCKTHGYVECPCPESQGLSLREWLELKKYACETCVKEGNICKNCWQHLVTEKTVTLEEQLKILTETGNKTIECWRGRACGKVSLHERIEALEEVLAMVATKKGAK